MNSRIKMILLSVLLILTCGCQKNGEQQKDDNILQSSVKKDKQEIVVLVDGHNGELTMLGARFNKQSDEYHVVFEELSLVGKDHYNERNTRLVSSQPADLYYISGSEFGELSEQNVIAPIEEYMDMELIRANYSEYILQAWERYGKLYSVPIDFWLSVPVIRSSEAALTRGCTPEQFMEWIREMPGLKSENGIFDVEILRLALTYGLQNYVVLENGNQTFDEEKFRSFITLMEETEMDNQFYYDRWDEVIGDGDSLFMEERISLPSDIKNLYLKYGDNLEFIGYPVENGELCCKVISEGLCLLQKSQNKEGAIAFLNFYLENATCKLLPTKKAALDRLIGKENAEPADELKNTDMIDLKQLISHARPVNVNNEVMLDMIKVEMKEYYRGNRNLDDTMKVLSSRLNIYLAEHQD